MPDRAAAHDNDSALYSVSLALLALALLVGFAIVPRIFHPNAPALAGKEAPDFALTVVANAKDKAQTQLKLSELRGQAVLLDFSATWCGPCNIEAPILDRVAKRYADRGLVVVGVNTSDEDGNAAVWARRAGVSYPLVYDEKNRIAGLYDVSSLPTLVLVSREGKILEMHTGITDDGALESFVKHAL